MFNLSFLRPLYLGALAFSAIPILIHLLHRRKVKVLPFSFVRFLVKSHKRRRRFLRIHNLLLLLLRIAILCLLALLFALPLISSKLLPFDTGAVPVSRIILLDDSASLAVSVDETPVLEAAKQLAGEELQATRPRDEVLVLPASQANRGAAGKLHPPYSADARLIEQCAPFQGTVNMTRALETALAAMEEARHAEREIVIISDFWKSSFPDLSPLMINPAIDIRTVSVRPSVPDNVAIENVTFTPKIIARGQPVRFTVRVANTGPVPRIDYPVTLTINGEKIQEQRCALPAGRSFELIYECRLTTGGVNRVTFAGGADQYEPDNNYHLAVAVSDVFYVLSVSGTAAPVRSEDEVFYLNTGLNPLDVPALEYGFIIQPVKTTVNEIDSVELDRFDVVCLANVGSLPQELVQRLVRYVDNGGGIAIFPGDEVQPKRFNAVFAELLPAPLVETVGRLNDEDSVFHLTDIAVDHPVFSAFKGELSKSLSLPVFHRFFRIVTEAFSPETTVLATLDRESPALIERRFGRGTVILGAFPVDADWGDLPHHPVFPPLVHQIFHYLNRKKQNQMPPVTAGEPFHRTISDTTPEMAIILHRPDESTEPLQLTVTAPPFFVDVPGTAPPGQYRIELVYPEHNRQESIRFASNVPIGESEFTPLPERELAGLNSQRGEERHQDEQASWALNTPLALVLLLALCGESILCALYTRRWTA